MKSLPFVVASVALFFAGPVLGGEEAPREQTVTLAQAIDHAIRHNPALSAMGHRADADAARLEGREGFPNPELSVEVEDFLGSGVASGADSMQVTTSVSQAIPLGGGPGARRRVYEAGREVSALERDVAEQVLIADVSAAFLEVLAHQRRLENAAEMVRLARETVETIEAQVDAGRATPMEVDKASVVLSLAELEKGRIARNLVVAEHRLATICGEEAPFFDRVEGTLDRIASLPNMDVLLRRAQEHPALLIQTAEIRRREALLSLEKAQRVPDVSLSLGYRWMNATSDSALVAGVAIPIPLVDRRQGAVGAAAEEELVARKDGERERLRLLQTLSEAYQHLAAEHERATVLTEKIYPKVQATFQAVVEGYRLGRFGYLDLLDAQRTLFEVKEKALEAMVLYQRAAIHLDVTAARSISPSRFDPRGEEEGESK